MNRAIPVGINLKLILVGYIGAARDVGDAFFSDVEEKVIKFLHEI